ncbi:MAG: hypothetical protein V4812_04430 [Pseudomonadota bacterium]
MRYTTLKKSDNEVHILCYGPYVIAIKGPHSEHPELMMTLLERLNADQKLLLLDDPTLRAFVRIGVRVEAEVDSLLAEFGLAKYFKGMLKPQGYITADTRQA